MIKIDGVRMRKNVEFCAEMQICQNEFCAEPLICQNKFCGEMHILQKRFCGNDVFCIFAVKFYL